MEDRKLLIRKKAALQRVKRNLNEIKSLEVIDIVEAESSEEIMNYRDQIKELNHYDYLHLAIRKFNKNNDIMIKWFFEEIPILKNNTIWTMPFDEMGIWWVKVKAINCREAIEQLWNIGEICIIEEETKACFYIQIIEDNCRIVFKQLQ